MGNSYVYPFNKSEYSRGKGKLGVKCILCSSAKKEDGVPSLNIAHSSNIMACVNLYPYNSGHIMLFPIQHVEDLRALSADQEFEITQLTKFFMDVLEELYNPNGFNIGYNLGEHSGASINHLHLHIIPRYANELGIVDLIGGSKVLIEDPTLTCQRIREKVQERSSTFSQFEICVD